MLKSGEAAVDIVFVAATVPDGSSVLAGRRYSWPELRDALDLLDGISAHSPESELRLVATLIRRQATALHAHLQVVQAARRDVSQPGSSEWRPPDRRTQQLSPERRPRPSAHQPTERTRRYTLTGIVLGAALTLIVKR